jgi:hypothetical protein
LSSKGIPINSLKENIWFGEKALMCYRDRINWLFDSLKLRMFPPLRFLKNIFFLRRHTQKLFLFNPKYIPSYINLSYFRIILHSRVVWVFRIHSYRVHKYLSYFWWDLLF